MAINKITTISLARRNAHINSDMASVDSGSLELLSGADVLLGSVALPADVAPNATTGTVTANTIDNVPITVGGTVAKYQMKDAGGDVQVSGNVSQTGDTDTAALVVSNKVVAPGDEVQIDSYVYTVPATMTVTA